MLRDYHKLVDKIRGYAARGSAYRRWYVHARLIVRKVSKVLGVPTERVADVLAITSPRCAVNRNLYITGEYLRGNPFPADVTRSTRAALKYWESTGKIRGAKTGPFARVLKGDDTALVVDSHLARAFGYSEKVARTLYCRRFVGRIIRRVARGKGWTIAETQAAVWAGYYRATYPTGRVPTYRIESLGNTPF